MTGVACMIYDGGDGVDVPVLAYAASNDTLHFHTHCHPPADPPAAASDLTTRDSKYQSHALFFAANGVGIMLSTQNVINRESRPASQADATGISNTVVNDWFYNRQDATHVRYEKVFTDTGFGGHVVCYVSRSTLGLLPQDTDFL